MGREGGRGGCQRIFLGQSAILTERDFLGPMKDARIFLDCEKRAQVFWGIVYFFISSNQQQQRDNLLLGWDFLRYAKK